MLTALNDRLSDLYGSRPREEQLRAKGMLLMYAIGVVTMVTMFGMDTLGAATTLWKLGVLYALVSIALIGGIVSILRGRDDLGMRVVPVAIVIFSLATLMVAQEGNPHRFFSNWSKWYAVFIIVNALFLAEIQTLVVTLMSIAWATFYFVAFAHIVDGTPVALVPTDLVDAVATQGMAGGITIALVRFAKAALARERETNAALEVKVAERTREVRDAFQERQAVIDHMVDGLLSVTPDGRIRVTNEVLERTFPTVDGAPAAELRVLIDAVQESGETASAVHPLEDGRVVKVLASPLPTEGGTGVVVLVHDITLEAEVDRLKTEFISTVSHELRTPLTSILGFSKMIRSRLERRVAGSVDAEDAKAQKALGVVMTNLDIVVSEGERLTELINDVLDIAKMEAGRVDWRQDPVDVAELVKTASAAVAGLFPPERGVELRVEVPEGGDRPGSLGIATGDPPRLLQVLVNLLSNASKFTESGAVTLAATRGEGEVVLTVRDTGRGIPADDLDKIFDRFRQVEDTLTDKPQGTGLGLPICRQIAQAHGTDITVTSTMGEGSAFTMVLPVVDPHG